MAQYYLSDKDRELVQGLLTRFRRVGRGDDLTQDELEGIHPGSDVHIAYPQTAGGIPAMSGTTPGIAYCDIYQLIDVDGVIELEVSEASETLVANIGNDALTQDYFIALRTKFGPWVAIPTTGSTGITLVECCLAADHPGRGIAMSLYLGEWDGIDGWDYTGSTAVTGIDWRYGVPYPAAGAKGLFIPRASSLYGTIYECVSLDCSSPGADCATIATGTA